MSFLLARVCATNVPAAPHIVNFSDEASNAPVGIFVGGTSGIGEGMARTFARHTNGKSNIIIVGRNKDAAENILSSLPSPAPGPDGKPFAREFFQCDATQMKNIVTSTNNIISRFPKINYLVLSTGIMTLSGRDETSEGIDKKLALHYYARWKFIRELLPAVEKAKESGEESAVLSILSAGYGGAIDVQDLGFKKRYSVGAIAFAAPTYNDLMMESYSNKSPNLPFIHAEPGGVRTGLLASSPSWVLRYASSVLMVLASPFTISAEQCGENMWRGVYSTAKNQGRAWRINNRGEDIGKTSYYGSVEQRDTLWAHTEESIKTALAK